MAYSAGDSILDDEYNNFVNSSSSPFGYNHFAGTGSTIYGLGQTAIATVSAGDTINAGQWNSLFTGIATIANHVNISITSASVSAGDAIAIKSSITGDLANLAAQVALGSPSATAISERAGGATTQSGTWNSTSTIERSVTFASANAMRHFFNAGGYLRARASISGTTDGAKDTVFASLGTAISDLDLLAHTTTKSGSGDTQVSFDGSNGFHDLGTSYTSKAKFSASDYSGYTSNTLEISAKLNSAASGGSATVLTFKMVAVDGAGDETYSADNADGVAANPNLAPAMVLTITEGYPTSAQGLSANIQSASNAEVSNSKS